MSPPTPTPPIESTLRPIQACASCRHFRRWQDADLDYFADLPDGWGLCTRITVERDPEFAPGSKATLMQAYSEHSDLMVAPDFGCREHEPKEGDGDTNPQPERDSGHYIAVMGTFGIHPASKWGTEL